MTFDFKIWNQGNDGQTMGLRAADVGVVSQVAPSFARPSDDRIYPTLQAYLVQLQAAQSPPSPFRRAVDILWKTALGYGAYRYFTDRVIEVTYSGNLRQQGGFAAQCYVIVDPAGYPAIGQLHMAPISVSVVPGTNRDLLEVTV